MNVERFIASRLIKGKTHLSGYAKPVLLVSVLSTTLGVAVMLLSVFIANGFKNQIRTKVIGFGSHIQVLPFFEDAESGSELIAIDQPFYKTYKKFEQIKSMQPVAYKPGIIQRTRKNTEGNREIQGVLFKGIDANYDKEFLKAHLVKGKLIAFKDGSSKDVLISKKIASNLSVGVGDTLAAVLISKQQDYTVSPDFRKFIVCGIYDTGLEEFDKEYAFIDISHIQAANGWGINVVLDVNDTLKSDKVEITLNAITTADNLKWYVNGKPYQYSTIQLPLEIGKYEFVAADADEKLISDTVVINIRREKTLKGVDVNDGYIKAFGFIDKFKDGGDPVLCIVDNTTGTSHLYTGGFEINLNTWEDLQTTDQWLYKIIGPEYTTKTIIEQQPQIFNWLELVEMNVRIIVLLMLLVAIINLVSAILVLILERSKMIGLLKSFGAPNGSVGKIFFYFTANILFRGIIFGNILVFVIYFIQNSTGFLQLNPETYFVSKVPIEIDWVAYLFVNALTIVVCLVAFLLPVMLVSRINPVKAIKIE
jgi:lipoprotein-releasing system permease protein